MSHKEYFTPLADVDVPKLHQPTLEKCRVLAVEHDVSDGIPLCYRKKGGFTLKGHATKAGPCYENFIYLQGWNFPDEATSDGIVFWMPRLLRGSTGKTRDQQMGLLTDIHTRLALPAHHLSGFGNVGLLAGLILAHFHATGERVPLNNRWARTDTCIAGGSRLGLGCFVGAGLGCSSWCFDGGAYDNLGVFALGVEALGS